MDDSERTRSTPPESSEHTGTLITLTRPECWELVGASAVARIGFVAAGAVQIIPINYQLEPTEPAAEAEPSEPTLILRTAHDGILAQLADGPPITVQVDYHSSAGAGWSVLMHGRLTTLDPDAARMAPHRVLPWAGGQRDLLMRFTADEVSGRRVQRHPARHHFPPEALQ